MPAAEAEVDDKIVIPPTVPINKLADKFADAMKRGNVPTAAERAEIAKAETEKAAAKALADQATEKPAEKPKIPAENFRILEQQRDEFKTKAESAEAQRDEFKAKLSTAIDPAKIAEYEKKLSDANAQLAELTPLRDRFYVEHSPMFKAAFTDKIDQARAEAKDAVGGEHGAKIELLLQQPASEARDAAIEEIGNDLSAFRQSTLVKAYSDLKRTEREKNAELAKAPENYKKLVAFNAEQSQKAQDEQHKALESAFAAESGNFKTKMPEFQEIDGNTDHNAFVAENRQMARNFLNPTSAGDRARTAYWAALGAASVKTNLMKDAVITKLTQQIKDMQAAAPSPGGGKDGSKGEKTAPKTIADRWNEAMTKGIPGK